MPNTSSVFIARQLADELFDGTINTAVVFSHIDIDIASLSKKERRQHHKRLDRIWRSIPNESSRECLLKSIATAIESDTLGLYLCGDKRDAIDVLTKIYDRLKDARKHDGYDTAKVLDDVGVIILWIDL